MTASDHIARLKEELQQTRSERDRFKYELDTMHLKYSAIYDKIKHGTYKIMCHLKNEVQRLTISKLSLIKSTALEIDKLRKIIGLLSRGEKVDDDIFKNYNNDYSQQPILNDSLPPNTPTLPPSDFSWKDTLNIDLNEKDMEFLNTPIININALNERRFEEIRQEERAKLAKIEQRIKDEFDSKLNMMRIQIEYDTQQRLKSELIGSIKNKIIQKQKQRNNISMNITEPMPPPPPQINDNSNISIPPPPPLDENIASNDRENDIKSMESENEQPTVPNHRKRSSRFRIDRNPYKPPKSVQDEMDQLLFDEKDMLNNNFSSNPLATKIKQEEMSFDDENDLQYEEKENEDWQIMGDLLFSIRHCLLQKMKGSPNESNNSNSNSTKSHLNITRNEWSSFIFEEYAPLLFYTLRSQWLKSDFLSSKYVKKLFGEESESLKLEDLDINESCKYYWRRLNTNSKSGQIFFQSVNGEYIIKSMPKSEAEFLRKYFLEKYCDHMMREPDSLLMHIMGSYKIQYKEDKNMSLASNNEYNSKRAQDVNKGVYVMVMKSILFCDVSPTIIQHKIYDLKGSTHNRTASRYKLILDKITFDALNECDSKTFQHEINDNSIENIDENVKQIFDKYSHGFYIPKQDGNETGKFKQDIINQKQGVISVYKRSKVLKDLDFIQDEEILNVGNELKNKYVKQLRIDLDFLCKMNVMDYSLLVGIHTADFNVFYNNGSSKERGNMFTFKFGGMCKNKFEDDQKINIYFTGIIDFLQEYNTKKMMESMYKRVKYDGKDAISSVDARTYANRLYEFIEKKMI